MFTFPFKGKGGMGMGNNLALILWTAAYSRICTLNIGSPRAMWPKFAMNISAQRCSLPVEADALCGDTITLGRSHSGESAGSGS